VSSLKKYLIIAEIAWRIIKAIVNVLRKAPTAAVVAAWRFLGR